MKFPSFDASSLVIMRTSILRRYLSVGIFLWMVRSMVGFAQAQGAFVLGSSSYDNRLFDPRANPDALHATNAQPPAVTFFNGSVGAFGGSGTPTGGGLTLVRSGFGQPVQSVPFLKPRASVGGEIVPDESNLLGVAPDLILPPEGAYYLASQNKLIATQPGLVNVTWGTVTRQYLISPAATQPPVGLYWALTADGGVGGPAVQVPSDIAIQFLWNANVPQGSILLNNQSLTAVGPASGLVVAVYTRKSNGQYVGLEVVDVRDPNPNLSTQLITDIGTFLSPAVPAANAGPVVFRYGLAPDPGHYLEQYRRSGDPNDGRAYAFKPTTGPNQINLFWTRVGLAGIVWPYEMDSYTAQWPGDFESKAMRFYLTDDQNGAPTTSPTIDLSSIPSVTIHYNDVILGTVNQTGQHTNVWLSGKNLHANVTGRILLHYENVNGVTNGFLGFQLVNIIGNLPDHPDAPAVIGTALSPMAPSPDNPSIPGRVTLGTTPPDSGPAYVYVHKVDGPMKGLIFPVRPSLPSALEVFWLRYGVQGVAWPYEMDHYRAGWTNQPQLYVRGHTGDARGTSVLLSTNLNAELTFQEANTGARLDGGTVFSTVGFGRTLLKYSFSTPTTPVGYTIAFNTVRSVSDTDASFFSLAAQPAPIGTEIQNGYHQASNHAPSNRPGFVYVATDTPQREDRFAYNVYTNTGQIFPVNLGNLEVWWMNLDAYDTQWPSLVSRYQAQWPSKTPAIVIASGIGTGTLDPAVYPNFRPYFQNDPTLPGFNPDDEHVVVTSAPGGGQGLFPLRSDLGTPSTSLPYVLMTYTLPANPAKVGFQVWNVVAEDATHHFQTVGLAGSKLGAPYPLSALNSKCPQTAGVSGPFWRDRSGAFWAQAAGDDGNGTNIVLHWFYQALDHFYFPTPPNVRSGACVPWLDQYAGTPGSPVDFTYRVFWPDAIPDAYTNSLAFQELPKLHVGYTLIDAKNGLPDIGGQCSVDVLYQQSQATRSVASVALIDGTRTRSVPLAALPSDVATENVGGLLFFKNLPPPLRSRLFYDPNQHVLSFRGQKIATIPGTYLLPNIITARDASVLQDVKFRGSDANFKKAVDTLVAIASTAIKADYSDPKLDSVALSAGVAAGQGYVTVAFGNSTNCQPGNLPISLEVVKVVCPLYKGRLNVVDPSSPFDEKLTLRFDGELGGLSDKYVFEWYYQPDLDGSQPPVPNGADFGRWTRLTPLPADGTGAVDFTIEGAGLLTLSDNWLICRYHAKDPFSPCGTAWSDWTDPQIQLGWIKRVVSGINPFEQRFKDLGNPSRTVNTLVSMLAQAGPRWEGDIPLNPSTIDKYGLIQVYETVLKEGLKLSVNGTPPVDYGPVDDQLILVAGRLSDLYMLLGNEAFADASDPTISVGADIPSDAAPTLFAFMNQEASLLEEELGLLRGRDDAKAPGVELPPVYNRLYWNFTGDVGETAYVLKHGISDELGNTNGFIDAVDAQVMYPQGHGDAWGHYLSATKYFYQLFRNPNFTWTPRAEATQVGGIPVTVNYVNERKFAQAAASKARAGAEIVNLTYRAFYDEAPENQWRGYKDPVQSPKSREIGTNESRAWGVSEWGIRAGQAALLDWVVGNALLPESSQETITNLVQRVDRTTVIELNDLATALDSIQSEVDKADGGVNPLGLAKNFMPFDIDPSQLTQSGGKTHFEQIYDRAVTAMNNAITVFQYAEDNTQQLRRQADDLSTFNKDTQERTADFNSRLIEIFGTPYSDDIGNNGQTYPGGYNGPDTQHYEYVDPSSLLGIPPGNSESITANFTTPTVNSSGAVTSTQIPVTYNISHDGYGMVKPANWTGSRRAFGEIQINRSDLLQARFRFQQSLSAYDDQLAQINQALKDLEAQYFLHSSEIILLSTTLATQSALDTEVLNATERELNWRRGARSADELAQGLAEMLPTSLVAGVAAGGDLTSVARGGIRLAGYAVSEALQYEGDQEQLSVLSDQQARQQVESASNLGLTTLRNDFDNEVALGRLRELVRQEPLRRLEVQQLYEALQQTMARYQSSLARGFRLLDDFNRFQKATAAKVQKERYKDMAFRIFRNDALQKYQAQFDLAAKYVYMAARAFDFETNFDPSDNRSPSKLLSQIMRSRAIGSIKNGIPQTAGTSGDPGLADSMARMINNWSVLQGQFGFNNPQREETQFSLRRELFRIPNTGTANDLLWRTTLRRAYVTNLYDLPEFRRFARFISNQTNEPGLVIRFGTDIDLGLNFFGRPLGGGDHAYDASHFATKIRSVGVWFNNYNNVQLSDTPRVFLIPIGSDIMRSPLGNTSTTRAWKLIEQGIPVPFSFGSGGVPSTTSFIPGNDTVNGSFVDIRQFAPFRAFHDGGYNLNQVNYDSRLIGRSVWNTEWWLVIPGGFLFNDRNEGLQRLIDGQSVGGVRDGNGIKDILMLFQTYSYQGQ